MGSDRVALRRSIEMDNATTSEEMNSAIKESDEKLDMDHVLIEPSFALRVPANLALRKKVLPIAVKDGNVYVACSVTDPPTLRLIQRYLGMPVVPKLADPESLNRALNRIYGTLSKKSSTASQKIQMAFDNRSVVEESELETGAELGEEILYAALLKKASDIHLDPYENKFRVRFRVDGELQEYRQFPKSVQAGLTSRFKVLSSLDIAEKRAPQDGGFRHRSGERTYDIRVATIPTKHGERLTLRILALQTESLTLAHLGMNSRHLEQFRQLIHRPHGLILLTGPTGSGKTTSLYAAIREMLTDQALNIMTIEDPIEYQIDAITQVEVDSGDKVSFQKALRSTLRHDPDVIMIGEIRDQETADVAIKSALTGHLVLSTLHTNSAVGAITRLVDMQLPRYLIGATLKGVLAQRLIRKLCVYCRRPVALTLAQAESLQMPSEENTSIYEPRGCLYCGNIGYSGRAGLFEMFLVDEFWSKKIVQGAEESDLLLLMKENEIPFLIQDGFEKLKEGLSSFEEMMSAVSLW